MEDKWDIRRVLEPFGLAVAGALFIILICESATKGGDTNTIIRLVDR
jgi:hypothetical protein